MPVPPFEAFLRPTLQAVENQPGQHWRVLIPDVTRTLALVEADFTEKTPKSGIPKIEDRISWALTYLRQARLIDTPRRGHNEITDRGRELLRQNSSSISRSDLMRFEEFQEFIERSRDGNEAPAPVNSESETPTERMERAYSEISEVLALEVASRLQRVTPAKFERIVVQLMLKLGYGGSHFDSGEVVGRSGDGGIDGLIRQDRLGLDMLYLQAKRWANTVGAPDIQGFLGALSTKGATKGVFITTSDFTPQARASAAANPSFKISLISGKELAKMMIEHDLGVAVERDYVTKRIDSDFFEED